MIAIQQPTEIDINKLKLWSENPRQSLNGDFTNEEIIKLAVDDEFNKFKLQSLIDNFGEFYDFSELPTVVLQENGEYLVLDGNRRLVIIMALQDPALNKLITDTYSIETDIEQLKTLKSIWCNVCSFETAIENVYRKHANNGSWNQLERDYFLLNHKNHDKSIFVYLDEQAGLISADACMNRGFVKDEVMTVKNLRDLGFEFDQKKGITSNYNIDVAQKIMTAVINSVKNGKIDTRKNRGELLKTIKENYPDAAKLVKPFNNKKPSTLLNKVNYSSPIAKPIPKKKRKTKTVKGNDKLFGKNLILKEGVVNNSYLALDRIYERFKDDPTAYIYIGSSLRVLVELAGRTHYVSTGNPIKDQDSVLAPFLKEAKKDVKISKSSLTYISIVENWLKGSGTNYVGVLHKFAHGHIASGKTEILETSYVVGAILEHYHKK